MLVYGSESYLIRGVAMKVYNELGPGFLESVYQEAMEIELSRSGIPFQPQKELIVYYDGMPLQHRFRADFVCYDRIIVEIKALSEITGTHKAQILNYLHATKMRLGLIFNFGCLGGVQFERLVL